MKEPDPKDFDIVALLPRPGHDWAIPYHPAWEKVLAWLDKGGDDAVAFNYNQWNEYHAPSCRTSACIGGYLAMAFPGIRDTFMCDYLAEKLGGVSPDELNKLFFDGFRHFVYGEVSAEAAAACIRHFLKTGRVEWARFGNNPQP